MIIYISIGTNLGDREANLRDALRMLDQRVGEQLASSSIYRSAPQGFFSNHQFANIVAVYRSSYSLEDLLLITQQIEREMGRTEKSVNGIYHDRVIDIDLLQAYSENGGGSRIENRIEYASDTLTLPHPRMQERDFVMIPLHEVEEILNASANNLKPTKYNQ
jgi:2-amino-4-hydroxy-6-hydroxymethyldihydropteridine diphosphokinase